MIDTGRVISTVFQFVDNFTNPSKKVVENMNKMAREIKKGAGEIERAGKTIAGVGSDMTKSITLPIAGAATAAFKMSSDFENAMAKVGTIADTTSTPMTELKKQVVDLSNTVGVGVTDIAEAQYQAISAGVDTAASVDFVSTAVKAAKGGFTDTATAVDGITTVLNAYGLEAGKAAEISDQMLTAQNFGKTTFGDMASSMGNVIPIASSLNVSTEELFGSIAVLTKNGIGTSEAVTGLKAAYSNILKPSAEASKMAQQLGLDFSSTHLQSVGWAKFLDEIKEKTGGNAETMAKLFGSTEALNSVTVLAGKGSEDFVKVLEQMNDASGMTQKAYEKMMTPTERMNISINKIKNALIQFGAALTPVFEEVAEKIGKVGDWLNSLSEEQVETIVKWGGIAAAVGPAIAIFGKIVETVGKVGGGIGSAVKMFSKFKGVLGLITSPAGIVIGVIAAIALGAFLIIKNWDKIKGFLKGLGDWFKSVFGKIKDAVKNALEKSGVDLGKFREKIQNIKARVGNIIENLKTIFKQSMKAIGKAISAAGKVFKGIIDIIKKGVDFIAPVIQVAFGAAVGFISAAVDTIADIIGGVLTVFDGITQFISGVFTGDWKKAWEGVKTIFEGVFDTFAAICKAPINAVIGIINGAIQAINKLNITIPDWVPGLGGQTFGINIPTIPMLYKGTDYWQGGMAMIHDRGGEIVDLPQGSRVYPHDKSVEMAMDAGRRSASGTVSINIQKLADKIEVRSDEDIDRIAEALAYKLKQVAFNTGTV